MFGVGAVSEYVAYHDANPPPSSPRVLKNFRYFLGASLFRIHAEPKPPAIPAAVDNASRAQGTVFNAWEMD